MTESKAKVTKMYSALEKAVFASAQGPINQSALRQNTQTMLENASKLLGYQNYLTQARGWKASQKSVSTGFEREVLSHATSAVSDVHALASSVLQSAQHLHQAGELDRGMNAWIAGVKASGPVKVEDLWAEVANDPSAVAAVKSLGVSDEVWGVITDSMKKVGGQVSVVKGKLTAEMQLAGHTQATRITFAPPAAPARTLDQLLHQGQFDSLVKQFTQQGALGLSLVPTAPHDLQLQDLIMGGAIQNMNAIAQHKRKLEDTGLAANAGDELWVALVLVAIVVAGIGYGLASASCGTTPGQPKSTAKCVVGVILTVLGALALVALGIALLASVSLEAALAIICIGVIIAASAS